MSLKVCENFVGVSNSLDPGVSSGSKLFAYGTIVMLGSLRVKEFKKNLVYNSVL